MGRLVKMIRVSVVLGALALLPVFGAPIIEDRAPQGELRVATFNIRYFGLGGSASGKPSDERRDQHVRAFLNKYVMPVDVIAFQEINDVPRLRRVLPPNWNCLSYDERDIEHQHVVLCASSGFNWRREPTDSDFIWDSIVIPGGKLRPAVHGILTDRAGRELTRVVALHLKAFPDKSDVRRTQFESLAGELKKVRNRNLPVIVMGDMNSYPTPVNTQRDDDEVALEKILDNRVADYTRAPNKENTYRSDRFVGRYDQIYVTDSAPIVKTSVFSVCGQDPRRPGTGYENPTFYYQNVSDHCPLMVSVSLRSGFRSNR